MDFKTFFDCVYHVVENRNPCLIRGRHGIGKSEIISQIAKKLNLKVVQRRASQMTEGDLLGLPSTDGEVTRWNPPDWFKTACNEPVVLFLDEVDRAVLEVRQGIFELTDSRQLAGNKLHPGTVIFAAINGGDSGAMYSVGEMDPAELDRYTTFDLEPTTADWLKWASKNCNDVVVEFIRDNPLHLECKEELESGKVYPSRRSWKRFNDCCDTALFEAVYDEAKSKKATNTIFQLAIGYLGLEAAVSFKDFLSEGIQITVEDLLSGKLSEKKIKKISVNQHMALIDRIFQTKVLDKKLTKKQAQNIANYMYNIPSEICMKFYNDLGLLEDNDNVVRLNELKVNGEPFAEYIISIISGDCAEGNNKKNNDSDDK